MTDTIKWTAGILEQGAFGRNGLMKTSGIRAMDVRHEHVSLCPITSRGALGRCRIDIPDADRAAVARAIYPEVFDLLKDLHSQVLQTSAWKDAENGDDLGLSVVMAAAGRTINA